MKNTFPNSHYETLRLDRHASPQRVQLAYRRMAQKFHPDKNQGRADAAALMARINAAYDVLSDPQKRAAYDAQMQQPGPAAAGPRRGTAMAAALQDQFGWAGWLLVTIACVTVLTLGYVTLTAVAPARPAFTTPAAGAAAEPVADSAPLAPVPAIQPWKEPVKVQRPVNEATEPVARLVREGVVPKPRRREGAAND